MTPNLQQELIHALAQWVKLKKFSYEDDATPQPSWKNPLVFHPHNHQGSRLEIRQDIGDTVHLSFVHVLFPCDDLASPNAARHESQQFNHLMEQVKLPTYVWENRETGNFELRWEETLSDGTELTMLNSTFRQSLLLSNTIGAKLGLKASVHKSYTVH